MAKRRAAEPLTFHVPWKRLLLSGFTEEPPLWTPPQETAHPGPLLGVPELSRKRKVGAGSMTEPMASPSKRRDDGDSSTPGGPVDEEARSLQTGELPVRPNGPGEEPRGALPQRGGGDDGAGRAGTPRGNWGTVQCQHNEEFWQYNTFQYWRNPLPPIDLADIEDVNEDKLTEATLQGKNELVEIDMES
ncbi:PREDICTED: uncharacterized protein C9orf40 homolog [Chrysochloris asiatica]|uniref:Uncharacterized protein C9orf40 homolog n=1 Tax=Chrysochloris asiatica TaxID=185453 RepID=A0A9B0T1G7_CHRAS|nr:PREDICTED: uncharacterized protein C9orf40 homolog [Chrysochloris asiatica]